jgi:type IV pilus assembly protein PilF
MRRALLVLPLLALSACITVNDGERKSDPKEAAKANVQLGVEYLRQGELARAKEKLERAEKQDPKNSDVYWAKASLFEAMNQPKEADHSYQKAMSLAPQKAELMNTYAVFLCKQGEVERAVPMFEKVIADKLYPTPYAAAANAGTCLRGDKRNADAQRFFERAIAMRPNFVDAVVGLADLQVTEGNLVGAAKTVSNYILTGNKSADVLQVAVRTSVAQKDCPAAANYARLLRRDFPNSSQAAALPQQMGTCSFNGTAN